jgi:hypothetical protein
LPRILNVVRLLRVKGVRPEVGFVSCNILWGKAGLTALGVILTFTSAFMAARKVPKRTRKGPLMSPKQHVLNVIASFFGAGVTFASSVVAGLVGSACPAP